LRKKCFWDCTGVFYGPYVWVSLMGVKNSLLRTVRIDRTYGPDVRAQKMTPVRTGRMYGRSLWPVRTGSVYRP